MELNGFVFLIGKVRKVILKWEKNSEIRHPSRIVSVRPSVNAEILHEMSQGSWDDLRKDHFAHEFCGAAWCPKNMDHKLVQVVILYDLIFVGNGCKQIPVSYTKKQTNGTT